MIVSLLIIIILLTLQSLSGLNCHRGGGKFVIDYWEECSIFEFAYSIIGFIIFLWIILFLFIYSLYTFFQKKLRRYTYKINYIIFFLIIISIMGNFSLPDSVVFIS